MGTGLNCTPLSKSQARAALGQTVYLEREQLYTFSIFVSPTLISFRAVIQCWKESVASTLSGRMVTMRPELLRIKQMNAAHTYQEVHNSEVSAISK
jgi:hypothetical protein